MTRKNESRKVRHIRALCLILVGVLAAGAIVIPVGMASREEETVSDFFYLQIYNEENQVVSKYKVALTGTFSGASRRKITDVEITRDSGDPCQTAYQIDGYQVTVTLTHPTEGYLEKLFVLGSNGRFF